MSIPPQRLRTLTRHATRADGAYVLYWMTATRRIGWNYALDYALSIAEELAKPLLIFEALRVDYPWASDRHHRFIINGMAEHARALKATPLGYYPYVELEPGYASGLLAALSADACCVVTDDSPVFFTPGLMRAASRLDGTRVEAVDSCGLLPLRAAGKSFTAAYHFRRFLQRELPACLGDLPIPDPLRTARVPAFEGVSASVTQRWPATTLASLQSSSLIASLPVDHSVPPIGLAGGSSAGRAQLTRFLAQRLARYAEDRNHPDLDAASGLSPWLHYGHLSAHEVFSAVVEMEGWTPLRISETADGRRQGWWGLSGSAEAFLDQLVTWRELGFGYCTFEPRYAEYHALPEWAKATLEQHTADPREHTYSLEQFASAETHDELWNAAQRQLVGDGIIHNYLRMLWGKKILEWTPGPREALSVMIELNNRYAIDGRDPNSYSGIFWCMGRFDRGWPERAIFGKVRSMTSASTRRKVSVAGYLERWGPSAAP
jgi:deoxyribodipyrimidine photo-lyase